MRYNGRRQLTGGVAAEWQVSNKEIRFNLRPNAKWQNGTPVTAHDFVFAWRKLVSPDTASPSATLASPIKNAVSISRGYKSSDQLGITAISDHELLIELEHPCAWCLKLFTNSIFYPINQEHFLLHGYDYGTSLSGHLSNGAYQLATWERGKKIRLKKNPNYWRADEVKVARLHFDYIGTDAKTLLNLYRAGEIAIANLNRDTIPEALEAGLSMRTYPTGHLFNLQFSHLATRLSANQSLRQAISLVIDKEELVNRVVASPGTRIADSMFHDWLTIGNTKFLAARPPKKHKPNIEAAKKYLAQARRELGLSSERIKLTLTINDSGLYRRIAEYLQQRLLTHLDIELAIDPQITQMMVKKWRDGTSDIVLLTWPVDVDDPMDQISFLGNPDFRPAFKGLYAGDEMAELFYLNRDTIEEVARLDAIKKVDDFFSDKVTVFPLFESYGAAILSPKIRGYVWQPVRGYADYRYVKVKK